MLQSGNVVSCGTGRYRWTIDDFLSQFSIYSTQVTSPRFNYRNHAYYMQLCMEEQVNTVELDLYTYGTPSKTLHVILGMKTGDKGERENICGLTDRGEFSVPVWMQFSEFMKRKSEILCYGTLTVFCEFGRLAEDESSTALQEKSPVTNQVRTHSERGISFGVLGGPPTVLQPGPFPDSDEVVQEESDSDGGTTVSERKIVEKLQSDFKNILDSREDCDVTVKVAGKEFLAHSIILRARSPVFKSMFSHDMVEKLSGVVVIEDCDAATFPDFLNYLYTGSTRHVSDGNVCQLYTASDKYQVEELKEECAAYMKKNLSVGNFCDILALALRHSERELIDLTTEFFCANATEIAETATWQTFLRENPTAGNELFLKSLKRKKPVRRCHCDFSRVSE